MMLSSMALTGFAAHPGFGWGGGGAWLFLLIPFFGFALLLVALAFAGRRWRRGMAGPGFGGGPATWHAGGDSRSAEKTLAERFAQGDVDEVEYRARLEVLRANRPGEAPPQ